MFVVAFPLYPLQRASTHMSECTLLGTSMNKVDGIFL